MDLVGEINRLAGVPKGEYRGFAGACNLWAGTTGYEAVGALNIKAGTWGLELNGVLQRLGLYGYDQGGFTVPGASGGLGSGVSTPGDAAGGGLNNTLRLPGIFGNYVSTPDTAALSITGDIDIRVRVALDDWTPSTFQTFVAKYVTTSAQRSYQFRVEADGKLWFYVSSDGTAFSAHSSTTATGFADGSAQWVRATRVQSSGVTTFYTSADGVTWSTFGSTGVVLAGSAIFDSTALLEVGSSVSGTNPLQGHVYYAEVRNGIGGPVVAAFDATTVPVRGDRLPATYTQPSAAEAIRLPGTAGNYLSLPDSPANSVSGDLDLRCKVALDDWTPAAAMVLVSKYTTNQLAYQMYVDTAGKLVTNVSSNGTTADLSARQSVSPLGFVDGSVWWVRVAREATTGVVTLYTSPDGSTWTPIAGTGLQAAGTIFDTNNPVMIGANFSGTSNMMAGLVYEAQVRNGIDGPVVASFNAADTVPTAIRTPATAGAWTINGAAWAWQAPLTAPSDGTANRVPDPTEWTVNGSDWWWGTYTGTQRVTNVLQLPGTNGNYASTPDTAALSITGDIDLRVKLSLDNWNTGVVRSLLAKRMALTGYQFRINVGGNIEYVWGNGTVDTFVNPGAGGTSWSPPAAGTVKWLRVTHDVDNGATGNTRTFYQSDDGVTWTMIGTASTTAGVTAIADGAANLAVGADASGFAPIAGTIHYAEIRNGIGGTVVGVFNPNILKYPSGQTPTTMKSTTGETYTISGSGWRWLEVPV